MLYVRSAPGVSIGYVGSSVGPEENCAMYSPVVTEGLGGLTPQNKAPSPPN